MFQLWLAAVPTALMRIWVALWALPNKHYSMESRLGQSPPTLWIQLPCYTSICLCLDHLSRWPLGRSKSEPQWRETNLWDKKKKNRNLMHFNHGLLLIYVGPAPEGHRWLGAGQCMWTLHWAMEQTGHQEGREEYHCHQLQQELHWKEWC